MFQYLFCDYLGFLAAVAVAVVVVDDFAVVVVVSFVVLAVNRVSEPMGHTRFAFHQVQYTPNYRFHTKLPDDPGDLNDPDDPGDPVLYYHRLSTNPLVDSTLIYQLRTQQLFHGSS